MPLRLNATQVTIGRGLRRTVDMFRTANEIVEENDKRIDKIAEGNEDDLTEE